MRSVQMHNNGPKANGSREVNKLVEAEKVVKDRIANGGQNGLLEGNRSVNNSVKEDINGVTGKSGLTQVDPQRVHQQPASQIIHWERFLHVRTLKVLLVETDDSTRHIVSALLRNCSYEVTAVSNGLEAWKILDDMNNQIDIVLTEVLMPGLSGIALLSKIQRTRKNTPVIMMSSHDSMGIVFKCLSKGAVDFLIKPIRKNELKNLWQHVWRKCHSSSGSGSESGVQNQKSTRSRSGGEESENDSGSREVYVRDGSDNGSGTQSSWTKKAVDVESPQLMSPWEQLSDPPDSTCAQVVVSRSEVYASNWVPTRAKEHRATSDQLENVSMDKELQIRPPRNEELLQKELKKSLVEVSAKDKDRSAPVAQKKESKAYGCSEIQVGSKNPKDDWMKQTADSNGVIISNCDTSKENRESELPSESCKVKDGAEEKAEDLPSVELTLKRAGDADIRTVAPDKSTLKHSKISAFTRYPGGSAATQSPTGNVGSCSPVENSSDAAKADSPQNQRSSSDGTPLNDMGSTTYRSVTKATEVIDKSSTKTTSTVANCANPSVIQPVEDGLQSVTQNDKSNVIKDQIHHHYHHYYHHHRYHGHCLQRGSGSGSGSNHGSNLQNGSSAAANTEGANMASNNWTAADDEAGVGSGSGSGTGTGLDQSNSAQGEATMNKSCQKRKERSFEKRVEHQSRKKSAEQRFRGRGQFVQQEQGNKRENADS